ncbi:MAG: hypothetical protein ACK5RL_06290 [Acidimicrobiales bacterium]
MADQEVPIPDWSNGRFDRRHLLRLARRRLVGWEHHAEDVVNRAIVKFEQLPAEQRPRARIEQIVKTEAYSLLRSEQRRRDRETGYVTDPSLPVAGRRQATTAFDVVVLRQAIAATCREEEMEVSVVDIEVFELLMAGYSLAEIGRMGAFSRHEIVTSRDNWRRIVRRVLADEEPATQSRRA